MRLALWPDAGWEDLSSEVPEMLSDPDTPVFVAERDEGGLCGFVEASIRPAADGIDDAPCAFVEGWWVDPDVRLAGIGRGLILAIEGWARDRGFSDLGSDTELSNEASQRAHEALGFTERSRNVYFGKRL